MKKIVVAGTSSGVGKTTVASFLLENLSVPSGILSGKHVQSVRYGNVLQHAGTISQGTQDISSEFYLSDSLWSALKITIRHEGTCPRHVECNTCDDVYEPYRIVTSESMLREKGKDTDRLLRAGACKVVWLQSDTSVEKAGIKAALACFDKEHNLIIEGNSFLRVQSADVAILVTSPSVQKIKRSAKQLLNKIDCVVINVNKNQTDEEIKRCKHKILTLGLHAPIYIINPCIRDGYSNLKFIEKMQGALHRT